MKKQNLALLVVVRASSVNKFGMAKTYVRITIDGDDTECYLGQIVPKDHWDNKEKLCLESYPEHRIVNDKITDVLDEFKAHFLVLSKRQGNVSPEEVKNAYLGIDDKIQSQLDVSVQEKTLLNIADEFIVEFSQQVEQGLRSPESRKQWRATRKKIAEFAHFQFGKEDIALSDIRPNFGEQLYSYLTVKRKDYLKDNTHKRRNTNLGEAAAAKQVKNIKQLIDIALSSSLIEQKNIGKYKTSGGDKEVIPLELNEVNIILTKAMPVDRLEEVRDLYIFQCFTGFAYKDLYELSEEHITYVGLNREPWLIKERGKTKVNEMVPLLPIAMQIIEKYKNHPYCQATNKLLPINSCTNYNGYLKEIATLCGINRNLKTHLARHTFADIMLNVCNIPLEDVSKMLGHRSIRTTMRYCRVRKERIGRNMKTAYSTLFNSEGKLNLQSVA